MAKKKSVAKKAKQLPLVEKKTLVKKSSAKFVSLSVMAVIPTQSYGNIQPKIEVQADTYEEARDFVLPHIKALYSMFAESKPGFLGKIEVTERVVTPTQGGAPAATPAQTPTQPQAGHVADSSATASAAPSKPKSEAVLKAEKALSLAATEDAAMAIQDQIEKSVKIAAEDKPELLKLCLKRRGELSKAK